MPGRSYTNDINEIEVSLAIEQLLIGPEGADFTIARVDPDSPPANFVNLGSVVEDTASLTVTREKFQLDTGIPRVRQYELVNAMEGSLAISLHSNSWRKLQFALGNYTAISSHTVVTSIVSVTNRSTVTLSTTSASLNVGRQIVISATTPGGSFLAGFDGVNAIETQIASITTDGLTLYLQPTPVRTPTAQSWLGYYGYVQQAVGTTRNTKFALLGTADCVDGSQILHWIPKVAPAGEWAEAITPDANIRIPLTFNAYGVKFTDIPGAGGSSELAIMKRIYLPRLT